MRARFNKMDFLCALILLVQVVGFILLVGLKGSQMGSWLYDELGFPHKALRRTNEYSQIILGLAAVINLFRPNYMSLWIIAAIMFIESALQQRYGLGLRGQFSLLLDLPLYSFPLILGFGRFFHWGLFWQLRLLRLMLAVFSVFMGSLLLLQRSFYQDVFSALSFEYLGLIVSSDYASWGILIFAGFWGLAGVFLIFMGKPWVLGLSAFCGGVYVLGGMVFVPGITEFYGLLAFSFLGLPLLLLLLSRSLDRSPYRAA